MKPTILISLMVIFITLKGHSQNIQERFKTVQAKLDSFQYQQAIDDLQKMLAESRESSSDTLIYKINLKLGFIYFTLEKIDIAMDYYRQSLKKAQNMGSQKMISNAYYGVAATFQKMLEYDSSIFYYNKSIPYFKQSGDSLTVSYIYSNLSLLFKDMHIVDSMKYYSSIALKMQLSVNDKYGSGSSYSNLGMIAKEDNLYQEAIRYYKKSLSEFMQINFDKGYSESLRSLAETYYESGNLDSAAWYFYIYDSIGMDVYHKDYQDKILELETKFKTAEVERDNALKQAEIEQTHQQLTMLYFILGFIVISSIGAYLLIDQRRKRLKFEGLRNQEIANQKIQDLLQTQEIKTTYALLEGQDKERKRIAIELHDNLGSILTSLNMFSDALQARIEPTEIKKIANRISDTSALANEEIRKISHSLDSGLLKHFGLKAAIKQLTEAVESAKNISFDLELQIGDNISNEKGLEVYRMIQELVNNSLKHAQCSKIRLEVNQIGSHLSIIFEDNGVGFDQSSITPGMGLSNIRNRAERLDGEFSIESNQGKGSTFIIELSNI